MAKLARECEFTVLDFETTGSVPGWPVEPWQLGMTTIRGGKVVAEKSDECFFRIAPERPFNPLAPGRHAKLRDMLAHAPSPAEQWPLLLPWLAGKTLVAHNIGTERSLLRKMAPLHRFERWVDTLQLVRWAYPSLPSKALDEVVEALGLAGRVRELCTGRKAHDALYDAFACAVLLEHLLALPGWECVAVDNLLAK